MTQEPGRVEPAPAEPVTEGSESRPDSLAAATPALSDTLEPRRPEPRPDPASDQRLARLGIALGTLALAGASLALTYHQVSLPEPVLQKYLGSNQLSAPQRTVMLISMVAAAGLPLLLSIVHLLRRGRSGERDILRTAALFCPLVLAWTLPSLLAYRIWYDSPLAYLTFLSVVLLAAERLFRRSFAVLPNAPEAPWLSERARGAIAIGVVAVAVLGYVLYTGYFSILEHKRLATSAYDLGIYDNLISNNLKGKFFRCPVLGPGLNYLSNHAEFGTILFAPIYALRPDSTTLLAMQSLFLGGAAMPLYLFASTQLPRVSAVFIAIGYLLYAPLHGPNFYDFHWIPMALPMWFGLFYGLVTRKKWLIIAMICLLLPIREEIGVMLAVLGIFLAASGYWVRMGIALAAIGTFSFAMLKFVIMPMAGTWWFSSMYAELIAPGEQGYGSVVKTLIVNPNFIWKTLATEAKLAYFLHLIAPLAFLPFRRPLLVFLAVPGFFFTLLTTSYEPTISIRFQYTTHWIPWVFGASVLALKVLSASRGAVYRKAALATLAVGIFAHSFVYGAVLQRNTFVAGFHKVAFGMTDAERARYEALRKMVDSIPKDASVAATETECPHIANRVDAYTLRIAHGDSDFLLVRYGMVGGEERRLLIEALTKHEYGVIGADQDIFLFKKGHRAPAMTATGLRRLGISLPAEAKTQSEKPPHQERERRKQRR